MDWCGSAASSLDEVNLELVRMFISWDFGRRDEWVPRGSSSIVALLSYRFTEIVLNLLLR